MVKQLRDCSQLSLLCAWEMVHSVVSKQSRQRYFSIWKILFTFDVIRGKLQLQNSLYSLENNVTVVQILELRESRQENSEFKRWIIERLLLYYIVITARLFKRNGYIGWSQKDEFMEEVKWLMRIANFLYFDAWLLTEKYGAVRAR